MFLGWTVISRADVHLAKRVALSDYLQLERNPGYLKPLGISTDRAYRPWLVIPTIDIWQEVVRKINKETNFEAVGRSPVLALRNFEGDETREYIFTIRIYRPSIICVEVKLKDKLEIELEQLFDFRSLQSHPAACQVADILIGIISSGDVKAYKLSNSFYARPSMFLPLSVEKGQFDKWRENYKLLIVGLLINNRNFRNASEELASSIFGKNLNVYIKYQKAAFCLVSKQGILTVVEVGDSTLEREVRREHEKRRRFLEYALALQEFISAYPNIRTHDQNVADFLLFLALPYLSEGVNIPKSVTGTHTWQLLSAEFGLSKMLGALPSGRIAEIGGKEALFSGIPPNEYDSLDYRQIIKRAMRPLTAKWIKRDFLGNRILSWVVATALAIIGVVIAIVKVSH